MTFNTDQKKTVDTRFLIKLILFPCLMFGFGFLLIPLYTVFCDITGLNGKISLVAAPAIKLTDAYQNLRNLAPASAPPITLQFTSASDNESWNFKPDKMHMDIIPGQQYQTFFHLSNPTNNTIEFTSIPSISPGLAAEYLIKTECFCFQKQILNPHESVEMPLVFTLRQDIPEKYSKLTLAYRIYAKPLLNNSIISLQ